MLGCLGCQVIALNMRSAVIDNMGNLRIKMILESSQLEYLEKSLRFLDAHYSRELKEFEDSYAAYCLRMSETVEESELAYLGEYSALDAADDFYEIESLSTTIASAILIRQVAAVERVLVQLAFAVQKKFNCPIPPNHNVGSHFTDCLSAVEYIHKLTDFNIKSLAHWKAFKLLRNLRHKFAHGHEFLYMRPFAFKGVAVS